MAAGYTVYPSHPRLSPKLSSQAQSGKPPNKQYGRQSKHTPAAAHKSPTYLTLALNSPFSCGSDSEHPGPPPLFLLFLQALVFGEGLLYKILGGEVEKIHFCVVAKLVLAM